MPIWAWILIAVGIVVLIGVVAMSLMRHRRSSRLRSTFGPEYERTVDDSGRRRGESELLDREKRRQNLVIVALSPADRQRYADAWREAQARFVDSPKQAIREADHLVTQVMRDRGYPMEEFEQKAADVSVDHPNVVENYRAAHDISVENEDGKASTENLRQAMVHYRALFMELLEDGGEEGVRQTG
jgi:FtsZ-interacting cell division protein ZipA